MYKQTNTICKPKRIRLFALIINCTILMKTNSRFSRNVYTISDRIWFNKHLRYTTTEKYENNGKGGYFRFDDDDYMRYRYILSITLPKWASWTHTTPYIVMKIKGHRISLHDPYLCTLAKNMQFLVIDMGLYYFRNEWRLHSANEACSVRIHWNPTTDVDTDHTTGHIFSLWNRVKRQPAGGEMHFNHNHHHTERCTLPCWIWRLDTFI